MKTLGNLLLRLAPKVRLSLILILFSVSSIQASPNKPDCIGSLNPGDRVLYRYMKTAYVGEVMNVYGGNIVLLKFDGQTSTTSVGANEVVKLRQCKEAPCILENVKSKSGNKYLVLGKAFGGNTQYLKNLKNDEVSDTDGLKAFLRKN